MELWITYKILWISLYLTIFQRVSHSIASILRRVFHIFLWANGKPGMRILASVFHQSVLDLWEEWTRRILVLPVSIGYDIYQGKAMAEAMQFK